jgi:hypothetical protein
VEKCDALLTDEALWTEVQQELLEICRTRFSPEHFAASMRDVLVECAVAPRG